MLNPAKPFYICRNTGGLKEINTCVREAGQWIQTIVTVGDLIEAFFPDIPPHKLSQYSLFTVDYSVVPPVKSPIALDVGDPLPTAPNTSKTPFIIETTSEYTQQKVNPSLERLTETIDVNSNSEGTSSGSSEMSRTSSDQQPDATKLKQFKKTLEARDKKCVLTGSVLISCGAAHFIPWNFFRYNEELWDHLYRKYCLIPTDEVFDVRNGILLRLDYLKCFKLLLFTIIYSQGVGDIWEYRVQVSEADERMPPDLLELNGKVLVFGDKATSPAPQFLEYHNIRFNFLQRKLKAKAEPSDLNQLDSPTIHAAGRKRPRNNFGGGDDDEDDESSFLDDDQRASISKQSERIWEESRDNMTFLKLA